MASPYGHPFSIENAGPTTPLEYEAMTRYNESAGPRRNATAPAAGTAIEARIGSIDGNTDAGALIGGGIAMLLDVIRSAAWRTGIRRASSG
jgi:hypothetical protein